MCAQACWIRLGLVLSLILGQAATAQAPATPLSEQELAALVGLGLDDQTVVARIKKGGLAFEVAESSLQKLKAAGASDAVVRAVEEVARAKPAPAETITYDQVLQLLKLGIDEGAILARLDKSPTIFTLDARQTGELKAAGASDRLLTALTTPRAAPTQGGDISDLAIILDCSGSMKELTTGGETKMEVAKRLTSELVRKIPDGLNVTFVVYGHEAYGGANDPRNCQAVKVARPLGRLDAAGKAQLVHMISSIQPVGATPIALSLRTAGTELKKNDALCGLVLITDGLETCNGNPAAEAAALAANLKVSFGVNVIGFGVKPEENAALKAIADAGKGKYYAAADARALTDAIAAIALEIQAKAKPPEVVDTSRRAIKMLTPQIEMPEMEEIYLVPDNEKNLAIFRKISSITKYDDFLSVPSSTNKYAVFFVPKGGSPVLMLKEFSIPERKVVEIKPESILGMVQVQGTGEVNRIYVRSPGDRGTQKPIQIAEKYGEIMVVPAGKYDIYTASSLLEEGLEVQAGKLYRLQ
jgi:hypothetical protein